MSHDDKIKDLEKQIRLELDLEKSLPKTPPLKFKNPSDLVTFLSRLPIQRTVALTSLSPFLRRFRTNTNLELEDVATAVNIPASMLIQFESSDFLPWTLPASAMVALASAYRIHIEAIEFLTHNSYQITRLSKAIPNPDSARTSMAKWLQDVRSQMEARAEAALLN